MQYEMDRVKPWWPSLTYGLSWIVGSNPGSHLLVLLAHRAWLISFQINYFQFLSPLVRLYIYIFFK